MNDDAFREVHMCIGPIIECIKMYPKASCGDRIKLSEIVRSAQDELFKLITKCPTVENIIKEYCAIKDISKVPADSPLLRSQYPPDVIQMFRSVINELL